ncbi:hypothetical protein GCM10028807_51540 [Spirosoma daeguense]
MKYIFCICWLILGLSSSLQAQKPSLFQYEFYHIQQQDGLSFNYVNCLFKDRDGFLWIGTNNGLNRFDGQHFTIFKHNPANSSSLVNNTVQDICQDKAGHLWLATDNGISEFNPQTGQFRNFQALFDRQLGNCLSIICDRSGDVWFSTIHHGLFRYTPRTNQFKLYTHDPNNPRSLSENQISIHGLLEDPIRNGIWIATRLYGGLNYLDIATEEFQNYAHNPKQLPVLTKHFTSGLALDGNQLVYANNNTEQIIMYDLKSRQITRTIAPVSQTGRSMDEVQTVFVDRQHNIWVSSWGNVMFYIKAGPYRPVEIMHDNTRRTSIAGSAFLSGWQDTDGTVWLGTFNGISYTNPTRALYEAYDLRKRFPARKTGIMIGGFYEDEDDGSWWGTEGYTRGLIHHAPGMDQVEIFPSPGTFVAWGLCAYGSDIYIANQTQLLRFSKKTRQYTTIPFPSYVKTEKIRSGRYQILRQKDLIWLFSESKQGLCYTISTGQWHQYPILSTSTHPKFWVRHALVDRKNDLWLELYPEGFARFIPSKGHFRVEAGPAEPEFENTISSFTSDKNGYFWMATNGYGLARYDPHTRKYRFWRSSDGLSDDHCLAALPDQYGNIWVGSFNLFSVVTPARHQVLNLTLPYSEDSRGYFNYLWRLRNGHILASINDYLIEFKPEVLSQLTTQPGKVLLGGLTSGDSTHLLNGPSPSVSLKSSDNSFSVQYAVLGPLNGNQYQYQYKLEGYENQWSKASNQTTAWYNKLPGGDYVFQVKAISITNQATPIRSLAIHIDTVFYQTAGFRALVLLSLIGIGIALIRYRVRQTAQLHHLQVQASRLERDKTEIQYQNLINHLNPHFLFNSLTSLGSLIIINPKQASSFLQKLSSIYRYILQNKEKDTVSLSSELAFVQHYVELQQAQFEDGLQITIDVPSDYLSYEIVPVTLQNLFENAIKHNTTEEDSPLRIQVYVADDYLNVVNTLQRKAIVKTSNKQGLDSLKKLYAYLSERPLLIEETPDTFVVKVPLL